MQVPAYIVNSMTNRGGGGEISKMKPRTNLNLLL